MFYSIIVKCLCIGIFLSPPLCAMESPKPSKVVIIGAGLAGLTTAYRLQEKGFEVEVFEARQRVGGRVLSVKVGEQISELGGQNIYDGSEAKNMLSLIEELGLEVENYKRPFVFSFFDGQELLEIQPLIEVYGFTAETLEEKLTTLASTSQNMQDVLEKLFPNDEVLQTAFYARLSAYEGVSPKNLSTRYISTLLALIIGGGPHQKLENDIPLIRNMFLKEGNSQLPIKLSEKLNHPVQFNHSLISITKDVDSSFLLLFENGKEIRAETVVLAIPCSVYEDISFEKNVIPEKKLLEMRSILYGVNSKILLPGTFKKTGSFTNGRAIVYSPNPNHAISFLYIDDYARFDHNTIEATFNHDIPLIHKVVNCPQFQKPRMALDLPFVAYDGPVGYSWPTDPFAKGSYSAISTKQEEVLTQIIETRGEKVKALFEPIANRFFFAGEHTSTLLDCGGTMEAAVESGEKAARLVEKYLKDL